MITGHIETRAAWRSREGETRYGHQLRPGDLIAIDYAPMRHRPWVLHSITKRDNERWSLIVRPVGELFDLAQHNETLSMGARGSVRVLPDHYSVCSQCGEIPPCSEVWTSDLADADAKRSARYEVPGVCPACSEPVTRRQRCHRFEENIYVPLGPSVVFHARQRCEAVAVDYDTRVAKLTGRDPRLWCEGMVVHHNDGDRICSNITCPNVRVRHRRMARCYVLNEKCNRPECWESAS